MRSFLYVVSALAVMGLAFWAYQENYKTQQAIAKAESLQRQIADNRHTLAILRAEWAFLNRPDRLRDLAFLNYDRLGLLPLAPEQFARTSDVAYPAPVPRLGQITDTVQLRAPDGEFP